MYPVRVHTSLSRVKKICSFSNLISFNFGFSITITRGNKLWKQLTVSGYFQIQHVLSLLKERRERVVV